MSVKEIILVILGGVLVNNYAFEKYLGICPVIGGAKCEKKALGTGLAVAVVMLISQAIVYFVSGLLASKEFGFLTDVAAVAIILAVAYIIKAVYRKPLGGYFPLIALNSAVLGLTALNTSAEAGFGITMLTALGIAAGFLFAMLVFAGVKSRIEEKYVPAAFRGLPIYLVAAFIISMALVAFK